MSGWVVSGGTTIFSVLAPVLGQQIRFRWLVILVLAGLGLSTDMPEAHARADYASGLQAGDANLARRIWRQSAWRENDILAQFELGTHYSASENLERDPIEAFVWYYFAATNAEPYALPDEDFYKYNNDARDAARDLLLSMGHGDISRAYNRIAYISWCRGAAGMLRLARIYGETRIPEFWDEGESPRSDARRSRRGIGGLVGGGDNNQDGTVDGSARPPNLSVSYLDILTYFFIAEETGLNKYASKTRGKFQEALQRRLSDRLGSNDVAEKRLEEMVESAKAKAKIWLPPFEIYADSVVYARNERADECQRDDAVMNAFRDMSDVKTIYIQYALQAIGSLSGSAVPDGKVGPVTVDAIKKFQAERGYPVTGHLDTIQTRYLIRLAAIKGHAISQNVLGIMYANCVGVPFDEVRAEYWFREAYERRLPVAAHNLRVLYYPFEDPERVKSQKCAGREVEDKAETAEEWRDRSAKLGFEPAQKELIYLFKNL